MALTLSVSAVLGFAVSCLACFLLLRYAKGRLLDHPNERSLHMSATPRSGGIAIGAGIATVLVWAWQRGELVALDHVTVWPPLAGTLLVFAVSLLDDVKSVPPWLRLVVHVGAAVLLLLGGLGMEHVVLPGIRAALPAWLGVLLTVLFVVWLTNLYNFMDGMDGLAGAMSVFGFSFCAVFAAQANATTTLLLCVAVVASAAGFLVYNQAPAKLFMGDCGASTLGFIAATMLLSLDRTGAAPLWLGILVFAPFVVDATLTLSRRAATGERVWRAHRDHYYQRSVSKGPGYKATFWTACALMLACGTSALLILTAQAFVQGAVLFGWIVVFAWLAFALASPRLRS